MTQGSPRRIAIVRPAPRVRGGNEATATRWARRLGELGCEAFLETAWSGAPCDALVALHARKSHASIRRFREERPDAPLVVGCAGTDIYGEGALDADVRESLGLATRIVLLQERALDELAPAERAKARVIHQAVELPAARPAPSELTRDPDAFLASTLAHLRPVKDPLAAARAARLVPPASRLTVVLVGASLDDALERAARREQRENPRFTWLGERPHAAALGVLEASRVAVSASRFEGGANAVGEALALGLGVLASAIPGSLGLLGADHPGTFPPGDDEALARLLWRAEREPGFRAELAARSRERAWLTEPALERERWAALLDELVG